MNASAGIPIVVIGAGGHGREIVDAVLSAVAAGEPWRLLGVLDDGPADEALLRPLGVPWLGPVSLLVEIDTQYIVGIGDGAARRRIDHLATGAGRTAATVRHPSSSVARTAVVDDGSYIGAQAVVMADAALGRHVHIDVGASVAHDCRVGDYSGLAPGARLGGGVVLEEGVFVGLNSCVRPRQRIGGWAILGAGATAVADLPAASVCVGTPARPLRMGTAGGRRRR
jgi:sugar O-acyltransferase (sialic acid O-acetyltransferase NeuD family)